MNNKLYSHELSPAQKRAFYNQETLEGRAVQNKYLIIFSILMIVIRVILEWVIYPKITGSHFPAHSKLTYAVYAVGVLSFVAAIALDMKKKTKKYFIARVIAVSFAWIGGALFITVTVWSHTESALKSGNMQDWIITAVELGNGTQMMILVSLILPVWYAKGAISFCYFLGLLIALFRTDNILKYWVLAKSVSLGLYVLTISKSYSNARWQMFTKTLETEGWCKIYQDILNKIPSDIAVLNMDSTIAYSNNKSKQLGKMLFSGLVQIKNRSLLSSQKKEDDQIFRFKTSSRESFYHLASPRPLIPHLTEGTSKLLESEAPENIFLRLPTTTSPFANKNKIRFFSRTRAIKSTLEFANFEELFEAFKEYFLSGEKDLEDSQLIFDGKLIDAESVANENRILSYEIRLFPLYDYNKVIVVLNNTTERDIIANLESNNEYKDRLLASISHELRTPLNANISLLEAALRDKRVSRVIKEQFLDLALRSSKLLYYIINDILDYSLVQSEELTLTLEPRSLRETIISSYKLVEKAMQAKNLNYILDLDTKLPKIFCTDHGRVTQIILNLLNNALKFTFYGRVILKVVCTGAHQVKISVSDTGKGMNESEVQNLFLEMISDNTRRKDSESQAKSKGIGLGLKVANSLVKKLGPINKDSIEVESEERKGSCFSFYLQDQQQVKSLENLDESDLEELADFASVPEIETIVETERRKNNTKDFFSGKRRFSSKRHSTLVRSRILYPRYSTAEIIKEDISLSQTLKVLIVDDDPFNIIALKALLRNFDFIIDEAYNGWQAVTKISVEKNQYNMIFMDCQMPIMDGYEATRELKKMMEKGEIEQVPIIGCTAFTGKKKIDECFRSGMKSVITKPVMKDKLTELINKYFFD